MRKIAAHYVFPIIAPPIRNGLITLSNEGEVLHIEQMQGEAEGVEFYSGILVPGFVNAHCHLELSHLLGEIPEHVGLAGFIRKVVALRSKFSQEQMERSLHLADAQMYSQGTVAVGDISNTNNSFNTKAKSPIFYHTFIEITELWSGKIDELLHFAKQLLSQAHACSLSASLTAHTPYSTSSAMLAAIAAVSNHVSIHNQESVDEKLFFEQRKGALYDLYAALTPIPDVEKSSIRHTLQHLARVEKLLMVHNTHTSPEDYDFAASCNSNISWVLCPRSNLYIENTLPPIQMLRDKGANIALGTDSLSSNHSLHMLDELKCITQNFSNISLNEMLRWATLGGAEALKREHTLGSFEKGKKPGVALLENLNLDTLALTPNTTSRLLTKNA